MSTAWVENERAAGLPITDGTIALIPSMEKRKTAAAINQLWGKGLATGEPEMIEAALGAAVELLARPY
jgi:hypothetical protein